MYNDDYFRARGRIIADVINDTLVEADTRAILSHFAHLPEESQQEIVLRVIRAQGNVVKQCVAKLEPITLPWIGKVTVKEGKRIEYDIMTDVVKDAGYNSIIDVPNKKYMKMLEKHKPEIRELYTEQRKQRNGYRRAATNAKVQTFNLLQFKEKAE